MKGIIFSLFNQLVEEKWSLEIWENLLDDVNPASGGAYTSAGNYPDDELFALIGALSKKTNLSVEDLVTAYGRYLLGELAKLYSSFFEGVSAKEFLMSIHNIIHVEVKKLYPDAELPSFRYEEPDKEHLVMIYRSKKKLCKLAEGLIFGTADHFGIIIDQRQTLCMLQGDDHCRFELEFKNLPGQDG